MTGLWKEQEAESLHLYGQAGSRENTLEMVRLLL